MEINANNNIGEVASVRGINLQYDIFAQEIYYHLLNSEIISIEFASENAGKLDDVFIILSDRVIAYQVKNIESVKLSFNGFVKSNTESIFQGVVKGWQKIRSRYPEKQIIAKLITTQSISENDSIVDYEGKSASFKTFIENYLLKIKGGGKVGKEWNKVEEKLLKEANLDKDELYEFIKAFSIESNYTNTLSGLDSYTLIKRRKDIERIADGIYNLVGRIGSVKLTKEEFLDRFGLSYQYTTHFKHNFFVDEKHYQPIDSVSEKLENIIGTRRSGYIALVGNAGSGKSTLLSKWIKYKDFKIFRYLAYTNADMGYGAGIRGEAEYFLHDILVQMREAKMHLQDRLPAKDLIDLARHFAVELEKISKSKQKVIIIVDGLDHINREQNVDKSLIEVLPHPDELPDNVFIVLGTRTVKELENLNIRIKESVVKDGLVLMQPLSKFQLNSLLESYNLSIKGELFENLYENTQGHPLFTRYTIEKLTLEQTDKYEEVISSRVFGGEIELEYKLFWQQYGNDDDIVHILGIICRFRYSYFNIGLLSKVGSSRATVARIQKVVDYYFYKACNVWQFFHSSFREFLINKTAEDIFSGDFDKSRDQQFHTSIFELCKLANDDYKWNEIYHLYHSGDFLTIRQIVRQEYFRKQWFEYRHAKEIIEDIRLAAIAFAGISYFEGIFVCLLAAVEVKRRINNFPLSNHHDLFVRLKKVDVANSFVFDKMEVHVDAETAMDHALLLKDQGMDKLASELFQRVIPAKIIYGKSSGSLMTVHENELDLIKCWSRAASAFEPIDGVIELLKRMKLETHGYGRNIDLYSDCIRRIYEYHIRTHGYGNLMVISEHIEREFDELERIVFYTSIIKNVKADEPIYNKSLQILENINQCDIARGNFHLSFFHLRVSKNFDRARQYFEGIPEPKDFKEDFGFDLPLWYAKKFCFLYFAINKSFDKSPASLIGSFDKASEIAYHNFCAELGKMEAYIYHGHQEAVTIGDTYLHSLFNIFHYQVVDHGYDYKIAEAKSQLTIDVLIIGRKLKNDTFRKVLNALLLEWEKFNFFWSIKERQDIVDYVIKTNQERDWVNHVMENIESQIFLSGYVETRIENAVRQINLWISIHQYGRAESTLERIMECSFEPLGEKDALLDTVIELLTNSPIFRPNELQFYIDRLDAVNEIVNHHTHTPALAILEKLTSNGNCFNLFQTLLSEQLITYCDGLEVLFQFFVVKDIPLPFISKIYIRLVLAFEDQPSARLQYLNAVLQKNPTVETLRCIVSEIKTYGVQEFQNTYLYRIQTHVLSREIALKDVGLDIVIIEHDAYKKSASDQLVALNDGRKLSKEELLEAVNTVNDYIFYYSNKTSYGTKEFIPALEKLIPQISSDEIKRLIGFRELSLHEGREIARILIENDKNHEAITVLEQLLARSKDYGWVERYDGGSKKFPYFLLSKLKSGDEFKSRVANDYAKSFAYLDRMSIDELLSEWNHLLITVGEDVNAEYIHREIGSFGKELLKNQSVNNWSAYAEGNNKIDEELLKVLMFLITFPGEFQQFLISIIIEEYNENKEIIHRLVSQLYIDGFYQKFLRLIQSLIVIDGDVYSLYSDKVKELINHPRADISMMSMEIVNYEGEDDPWEYYNAKCKTLPLAYSIEYPDNPSMVDGNRETISNINDDGYFKDSLSPLAKTKIFSLEIEFISKNSGLSKSAIANRIIELGERFGFPEWCKDDQEDKLRIFLDNIGLRIPYNRPVVNEVIDGYHKVLRELFDLNIIPWDYYQHLISYHDPGSYFVQPETRPTQISQVKVDGGSRHPSENWAKEIDDDYLQQVLGIRQIDDYFIIGESSDLRVSGHSQANELREMELSTNDQIKSAFYLFQHCVTIRKEEYEQIDFEGIIVKNAPWSMDERDKWLAVNPNIARTLGLSYLYDEDDFRWVNDQNEPIIKSLFWRQGITGNNNSFFDSEFGSGWMVLLRKDYFKCLLALYPNHRLNVLQKITRNYSYRHRRSNTSRKDENSISRVSRLSET